MCIQMEVTGLYQGSSSIAFSLVFETDTSLNREFTDLVRLGPESPRTLLSPLPSAGLLGAYSHAWFCNAYWKPSSGFHAVWKADN